MNNYLAKIASAFRRAGDRLAGRHVPIRNAEMVPLDRLRFRRVREPDVDIYEDEREVWIRADVPGATVDNTQLYDDAHGTLTLMVERWDGAYWYRTFSLPQCLDRGAGRATVQAGVVDMHLPKRAKSAPAHGAVPVS